MSRLNSGIKNRFFQWAIVKILKAKVDSVNHADSGDFCQIVGSFPGDIRCEIGQKFWKIFCWYLLS